MKEIKRINEKEKQKKDVIDQKLQCFKNVFQHLGINIEEMQFQFYPEQDFVRKANIISLSNEPFDVKKNTIINMLDNIRRKGKYDCNQENVHRANQITLNLISNLYEKKFGKRKISGKHQDLFDTFAFSKSNYYIEVLSVFYYAYTNTDLRTCEKIASQFSDYFVWYNLSTNLKLLSESLRKRMTKDQYDLVIDEFTKHPKGIHPKLPDIYFKYLPEMVTIQPEICTGNTTISLFFRNKTIEEAIEVFGLKNLLEMNREEIRLIRNQNKKQLENIKEYFQLYMLSVEQIENIINDPESVQLFYKKLILIKQELNNLLNKNFSYRKRK